MYNQILEALQFLSTPEKRDFLPYFFKTGKGQYAEGCLLYTSDAADDEVQV